MAPIGDQFLVRAVVKDVTSEKRSERGNIVSFEDGGRGHKLRNAGISKSWKGLGKGFFQSLQKRL